MRDMGLDLIEAVNATDHVLGPEQAEVTIVEYGDFECRHCGRAAANLTLVLERFAERVRFVFRHSPREDAHPHALLAAEAAECAASQGKFWAMHDLMFANQRNLALPDLMRYGQQLDLDMTLYTQEMADHVYLQRVREHIDKARASSVRRTPAFFVDGVPVSLSFGTQALLDATEAALHRHSLDVNRPGPTAPSSTDRPTATSTRFTRPRPR